VLVTSVFDLDRGAYLRRLSVLQLGVDLLVSLACLPMLKIVAGDALPLDPAFLAAAALFIAAGAGVWYVRRLAALGNMQPRKTS